MPYSTVLTQRSNNILPNGYAILAIAKGVEVSVEFLLSGVSHRQTTHKPRAESLAKHLDTVRALQLDIIEPMILAMPSEKRWNVRKKGKLIFVEWN